MKEVTAAIEQIQQFLSRLLGGEDLLAVDVGFFDFLSRLLGGEV